LVRLADHPLPAIVMAGGAVIDLRPVRHMAGVAGQFPVMAIVRVARQKGRQLGHILLGDVTFGAHRIGKLHLRQVAVFIHRVVTGKKVEPSLDLNRDGVVVAVLALHLGLLMHMVQVGAGQEAGDVTLHDMVGAAELQGGVGEMQHIRAGGKKDGDHHHGNVGPNADLQPVSFFRVLSTFLGLGNSKFRFFLFHEILNDLYGDNQEN
jgi:hypothetical protein